MKKCLHCSEICEDSVSICPKCGALVEEYVDNKTYMNVYHINQGKKIRNFKLIWWFLLGLFLPYIGFLVSWIFYDGERERDKAILLGAIVSTLVTTLLSYLLPLLLAEGDDKPQDDSSNSGQVIKNLIEIYKSL